MIQNLSRLWATESRGQTAVLFTLLVFPILTVLGFSIDTMRQVSLKKVCRRSSIRQLWLVRALSAIVSCLRMPDLAPRPPMI